MSGEIDQWRTHRRQHRQAAGAAAQAGNHNEGTLVMT
jgi:hypothetical protein